MSSSDSVAAVRYYGSTAYDNPSVVDHIEEPSVGANFESFSQDNFDLKYGFSEKPLPSPNRNILELLSFQYFKIWLCILDNDSRDDEHKNWKKRIWKNCSGAFPFFTWIRSYGWKSDLFADFVAGCTVGVIQIPQGKNLKVYGHPHIST